MHMCYIYTVYSRDAATVTIYLSSKYLILFNTGMFEDNYIQEFRRKVSDKSSKNNCGKRSFSIKLKANFSFRLNIKKGIKLRHI